MTAIFLGLTPGAVVMVCLGRRACWGGRVGWFGWWGIECDAQPDLDVPAGYADVFDQQAQQLLFLGVIE